MLSKIRSAVPIYALVAMFFLTFLIEAPWILYPWYAGDSYKGINVGYFSNDEHNYLSRGNDALAGNGLGQPYLAEGKDLPGSFQSYVEHVMMAPFRFLGFTDVNVITVFNIYNTIGVFVLILLIYAFAYHLSRNALISLTCAIFTIGGYILVEYGSVLGALLHGRPLIPNNYNVFGRSTDPYTALVPFFGFLILTYRTVTSRFESISSQTIAPYLSIAGAGILLGILFYDYFYAWTFALAFLGVLFWTSVFSKRWSSVAAVTAIGCIGVFIALPMLINFYKLFASPLGAQYAYFFQTEKSHVFIESTTSLALTILLAVYAYVRRGDRNTFFISALVAACWIVLEQQMLTGTLVQYGHYYWYFVVPLSIILGIYMTIRLVPERIQIFAKWGCVALMVSAFFITAAGQYKSFFVDADTAKLREQDFAPIMERLREEPKAVVLIDTSDPPYPFLVTILTDHDVYWMPAAAQNAFSPEYLKEVFFTYLYLNRESRRDPGTYLKTALASPAFNAYTIMYVELEGFNSGVPLQKYFHASSPQSDPDILAARKTYLPNIVAEYVAFTRNSANVRAKLLERGVRYVIWDKQTSSEWDLSVFRPLTLIATSTDLMLYSLSTTR